VDSCYSCSGSSRNLLLYFNYPRSTTVWFGFFVYRTRSISPIENSVISPLKLSNPKLLKPNDVIHWCTPCPYSVPHFMFEWTMHLHVMKYIGNLSEYHETHYLIMLTAIVRRLVGVTLNSTFLDDIASSILRMENYRIILRYP